MFKRDLKKNVKDQLMWDGRRYDELDIFYEIIIELDDKLYEKKIEKNPKKPTTDQDQEDSPKQKNLKIIILIKTTIP